MSEPKVDYDRMFRRSIFQRFSSYLHEKLVSKVGPVSANSKVSGGTAEEWIAWDAKAKKEASTLYHIKETYDNIHNWFSIKYQRYYKDVKYNLYHRFKQSHHIKPKGLKAGSWYEIDEMMLHGVMQLIVNYVEKQHPFEVEEYRKKLIAEENEFETLTEKQQECAITSFQIYSWWKNYQYRKEEIENIYLGMDSTWKEGEHIMIGFTQENLNKNRSIYDMIHKKEEELKNEETEMLIKAVKIRNLMWT
jgi:hypothetical protein